MRLQVNTTTPLVLKITLANGYLDKRKIMGRNGRYMPAESAEACDTSSPGNLKSLRVVRH